ncbi:MAG: hypothetical protein IIX59_01105 [Alistipes sp.]|nr:hypothetical protein [Alistipes sp.]MBQ2418992.1 hypothetical protein [Alistipes sp.]
MLHSVTLGKEYRWQITVRFQFSAFRFPFSKKPTPRLSREQRLLADFAEAER